MLKAYRNQHDIAVEWTATNDVSIKEYEVQTSTTGSGFTTNGTVLAKVATGVPYKWLDVNAAAGMHYYRIKSNDFSGKEKYSAIVKVLVDKTAGEKSIMVYGNTFKDNNIVIQFNNLKKDNYSMQLFTMEGQLIKNIRISHSGGSLVHSFLIDGYLPAGKYQIAVCNKTEKYTTAVIKE